MEKVKISEYCKKIRKDSGLTAEQFAKQRGVSRAYISKIEAGESDKPSIVVLSKIAKVYDLDMDELFQLDVDEVFIEGAGLVAFGKNPLKDNRSIKQQLEDFNNRYLIPNGYKADYLDLVTKSVNSKAFYDLSGTGNDNEKFYGTIINGFSTQTSDKRKQKKVKDSIITFLDYFFTNIEFGSNDKIHLFIVTNSESVIKIIEDFRNKHIIVFGNSNFRMTAVYIFRNRPIIPVEII
ncbi:MAG: helix-turn-helix transcriptional regulator [Erysipelotrichaceae bacterium]|nr:helix-turn-helix transcriptional regulator [Erysipelotrichaceae bacterium]